MGQKLETGSAHKVCIKYLLQHQDSQGTHAFKCRAWSSPSKIGEHESINVSDILGRKHHVLSLNLDLNDLRQNALELCTIFGLLAITCSTLSLVSLNKLCVLQKPAWELRQPLMFDGAS